MISILTTGGTIEGLDYQILDHKQSVTISIRELLENAKVTSDYSIDNILDKDSRFISDADRELIVSKIKSSNADKIILTHGTLTMVETAIYLGKRNIDKTIVLTGAFILGTKPYTDAPFNLGFAISALGFLNKGVYIAMNGKIFPWNNVRKNIQENRFETFSD